MPKVVMYTKTNCPYCTLAEKLLAVRGVKDIEKILIDGNDALRDEMIVKSGLRTVPQIFIGRTHVGGFDRLSALDRAGKLVPLLQDVSFMN
ncbi:MAG: glutaredoxin 3 [Oxalobacter sp.]|nr:glutaredoxin 3 [Oxalobacter sp.]